MDYPTPAKAIEKTLTLDNVNDLYQIRWDPNFKAPPTCLSIRQRGQYEAITIGTYGNFSALIGKAKSRKSFFALMLAAAMVRGRYQNIETLPFENRVKVLIFDTEQSEAHVQRAVNRAVKMLQTDIHPANLHYYHLRPLSPIERLKIINLVIEETKETALVIIDGVRDLLSNINDPDQATELITYLMRWTEKNKIHIVNIIHQNKADMNARGHLGTELMNKSETVIEVIKDPNDPGLSVIYGRSVRSLDFDAFGFRIENEIPIIDYDAEIKPAESLTKQPTGRRPKPEPGHFHESIHREVLKQVFREVKNQRWGELIENLKSGWAVKNVEIGQNKAREFINYYIDNCLLYKSNKLYYFDQVPF